MEGNKRGGGKGGGGRGEGEGGREKGGGRHKPYQLLGSPLFQQHV